MGNKEFAVSQAGGDDQPFMIQMPPEQIAEGGYMLCPAKGCTKSIPVREGAGSCTCGAKFEISPALLNLDEEEV